MKKYVAGFYVLLVSCAFGLSVYVSRSIGNLAVLGGYSIFLFILIVVKSNRLQSETTQEAFPFQYHPALLIPAVVLWIIFVVGFALNPSFRAFVRLGAFSIISAISIFVVPAVVSREQAFQAIGIFSAICAVIGFPTIIWGDYTALGLELGQAAGIHWITPSVGYRVPAAIFDSVKYFRVLVAMGAICSGGLYAQTRDSWMGLTFVLNSLMVILTVGRASILAVLVAGLLAMVYRFGNSRALAGVTLVGGSAVVVVVGITFGILPGPTALGQSLLGKRVGFWSASYQAFAARPILGWGLADTTAIVSDFYPPGTLTGTHNSYLRLFVIGGSVGGIAYLMLCASALVLAFRAVRDRVPLGLTTFCLVVTALIFQIFDGATIFGTALSSVLWAFTLGYAQPAVATLGRDSISSVQDGDVRKHASTDSASPITSDSE